MPTEFIDVIFVKQKKKLIDRNGANFQRPPDFVVYEIYSQFSNKFTFTKCNLFFAHFVMLLTFLTRYDATFQVLISD